MQFDCNYQSTLKQINGYQPCHSLLLLPQQSRTQTSFLAGELGRDLVAAGEPNHDLKYDLTYQLCLHLSVHWMLHVEAIQVSNAIGVAHGAVQR